MALFNFLTANEEFAAAPSYHINATRQYVPVLERGILYHAPQPQLEHQAQAQPTLTLHKSATIQVSCSFGELNLELISQIFHNTSSSCILTTETEESAEESLKELRDIEQLFDDVYDRLFKIDKMAQNLPETGAQEPNKKIFNFAPHWDQLRKRFRQIANDIEEHAAESVAVIDSMCATLSGINCDDPTDEQIANFERFLNILEMAENKANTSTRHTSQTSSLLLNLHRDVTEFRTTFITALDQLKDHVDLDGLEKKATDTQKNMRALKIKLLQEALNMGAKSPAQESSNDTNSDLGLSLLSLLATLTPSVVLCAIMATHSGVKHAKTQYNEYKKAQAQACEDHDEFLRRWRAQSNKLHTLEEGIQVTATTMHTICEKLKAISGIMKAMRSQCIQINKHLMMARHSAARAKQGQNPYKTVKTEINLTVGCYTNLRSHLLKLAEGI